MLRRDLTLEEIEEKETEVPGEEGKKCIDKTLNHLNRKGKLIQEYTKEIFTK